MLFRLKLLLVCALFFAVVACSNSQPDLVYRAVVPDEFKDPNLEINLNPPNGDPEPVRYSKAHKAFWWNCVMVRAQDLNARCPIICSGTPAAARGCGEGALDAADQIEDLLRQFPPSQVQSYLKSLASSPGSREKLSGYGYFTEGPKAEDASE